MYEEDLTKHNVNNGMNNNNIIKTISKTNNIINNNPHNSNLSLTTIPSISIQTTLKSPYYINLNHTSSHDPT